MKSIELATEIDETDEIRKTDYILQKSEQLPDYYKIIDKVNGVEVNFEIHKFNETQRITFLKDVDLKAVEIAIILSRMGNWLMRYHRFYAVPLEKQHRVIIGQKIRELRCLQNLSIQQLADMCGLTRSHISKIEAGRYNFTIDTLYAIANALGKDVDFV